MMFMLCFVMLCYDGTNTRLTEDMGDVCLTGEQYDWRNN